MADPSATFPFPNLFTESFEMTIGSIFVFAIADLRRLARQGDLPEDRAESVLVLPMSGPQILSILQDDDLQEIIQQNVRINEIKAVGQIFDSYLDENRDKFEAIMIHYFGDDRDCTYGIGTNSQTKTITLCFRGSMTMSDWITDAKMVYAKIKNPIGEEPETLGVHKGFRDYLYSAPPDETIMQRLAKPIEQIQKQVGHKAGGSDSADPSTEEPKEKMTRLERILQEVETLLKEFPERRLYISGHSLGGALALLTAVEAAVRFGTRERPVTCVAVANPRTGDQAFCDAIHELEQQGRLRCLLVHNDLDLVPHKPGRLMHWNGFRAKVFGVPGIQLTLSANKFQVHRNKKRQGFWEEFRLLRNAVNMAQHHNYRTYLSRLQANQEGLSHLSLNEIYTKHGIDHWGS